MTVFVRYLSLWVGLCLVAGLGLGSLAPMLFQSLAGLDRKSVV